LALFAACTQNFNLDRVHDIAPVLYSGSKT
jgi:hypothetical protein